ncbi:MAG: response regulator [Thermoanaerobaculia bacterium]|nr:response regulator [Thermoanaerobaculia bacterium]
MDGTRILVVEDNPYNLELVQFLLEEANFTVDTAVDAQEVREGLQVERPQMILMDMQLPGTDGLTLVEELRRRKELDTVPIVALTAHALRGDRERFLECGCDGYLPKPIDVSTFIGAIRDLLKAGRRVHGAEDEEGREGEQ